MANLVYVKRGGSMPIKIVYGAAGTGKTHRCLSEISQLCKADPLGSPLYLIVPEQASFEAEKQLAEMCGGGFMRAQAFGFKRFAYRLMNEQGRTGQALSDTARRLVVKRLLQLNAPNLKIYGGVSNEHNFAAELSQLFRELKNSGIMPTDFSGKNFCQAQGKLADLALLYREWEDFKTANGFLDPEDYLNELPQIILSTAGWSGAKFWFDGFSFFSNTELNVIAALLTAGCEVVVTLCIDDIAADYSEISELFYQQWTTIRRLKSLQNAVELEELSLARRFDNDDIIAAGLALRDVASTKEARTSVQVIKAASVNEEAAWIARKIIELVRTGFFRFRDIAVVGRSVEEYRNAFETAFRDAEINFAFDQPPVVARHFLTDFVRALLEIKLHGRDYRSMFTAIKTGLFEQNGYTVDDYDLLENYVLKYGIRGATWMQAAPWDFAAKEAEFTGREAAFADVRMDELRQYINSALEPFTTYRDGTLTVGDYIARIDAVLEKLNVAGRMKLLADNAADSHDVSRSNIHQQIQRYVEELFLELNGLCGTDKIKLEDFAALLAEGFDSVQIKATPPGLDYIAVCSLDRMKMPERKALFLFGLNEGVIPARGAGSTLLNDDDLNMLNSVGLDMSAARNKLFTDRFTLYAAMSQAKEQLYLSYALANNAGKPRAVSMYLEKISRMLRLPECTAASYASLRERIAPGQLLITGYLSSLRSIEKTLATIYSSKIDVKADLPYWTAVSEKIFADGKNIIEKAAARLDGRKKLPEAIALSLHVKDGEFTCSISKLETFANCPFKFFADYGLKLREREINELDILDVGNLFHGVLQKLGMKLANMDDAALTALCRQEFTEIQSKIKNQLFSKAAYNENLAERLYKRFEKAVLRFAGFSRNSALKPEYFEREFGRNSDWPPIVVAAPTRIIIEGKIDRVDCGSVDGQEYALLVDYKNGRAVADFTKIYNGVSLQLPVYLTALRQTLKTVEIAGMLYLGMKDDRVSAGIAADGDDINNERYDKTSFTGIVNDNGIMDNLDKKTGKHYEYIAIKNSLFDSGSLELLRQNALTQAANHVAAITGGNIEVKPVQSAGRMACDYCKFAEVCHFEQGLGDQPRELKKINAQAVLDELQQRFLTGDKEGSNECR
ncbi:MAG: PD-(D/E)XK nuclease family protein [Negativicutes bacterium]